MERFGAFFSVVSHGIEIASIPCVLYSHLDGRRAELTAFGSATASA